MKTLAALAVLAPIALVATNAFAQYPPPAYPPAPPPGYGYPPPAYRPPPPTRFGNVGVLDFAAATSGRFLFSSTSHPNSAATSDINFDLEPSAQYFVAEGLSVGGFIDFAWDKPKGADSSTTFGVGPTVGYNLWLAPELISLWPQATVSFQSTSFSLTQSTPTGTAGTGTTTTTTSVSETKFTIGIYVPLLIHPVQHFHFGVGPFFTTDLSSKASSGSTSADGDKATTVGVKFEIGGWIGPL